MSEHTIKCRDTGEALANKLDGGTCVCKPGECEMRKLRNREGDYEKKAVEDEGFDVMGFAIALATGFPISPRGITGASILGALLHPTERHAAYDVTSDTPRYESQPGTPPAPVRDPDWSDNTREVAPRYALPTPPDSDPSPSNVMNTMPTPPGEPPSQSSYSAPEPSYSAPEPPPSFDSGGSGSDP